MKVTQEHLLNLMGMPDARFQIPIYQRVYAWTQRQCEEFWTDVMRAGSAGNDHFIGTVLYGEPEEDSPSCPSGSRTIDLIDGQQRFTTTTLLLLAIRDRLADPDYSPEQDPTAAQAATQTSARTSARAATQTSAQTLAQALADPLPTVDDLNQTYFFTTRKGSAESDAGCTKLELSHADQPTLAAMLSGDPLPEGDALSSNLVDNYTYFKGRITDSTTLQQAWVGLGRLLVISAQLEKGDQPQAVFESLNSKGLSLSPADLIRNLLFVHFGYDEQKRLYQRYWEPIENMFPEDADMPDMYLDAALHAWLEENAPELKLQDSSEIYSAFKTYVRNNPDVSLEDLLKDLHDHCDDFSKRLDSREAKRHIDWVQGKLTGLVSERKLFGD